MSPTCDSSSPVKHTVSNAPIPHEAVLNIEKRYLENSTTFLFGSDCVSYGGPRCQDRKTG